MRQKLGVTLAVAVLALAGARETCKQFNQLKSLAAEWSGVWGTMLVYAGAYAEGVTGEPERQALIASNGETPCPGGTTLARARRAVTTRQTPRARREAARELTIRIEELALGLAARPGQDSAAGRAPERGEAAAEIAAAAAEAAAARAARFFSALEAESAKSAGAGADAGGGHVLPASELLRLARGGAAWETARVERPGRFGRARKSARVEKRLVFMLPELPLSSAEARRADGADTEEWPGQGGPEAPADSVEDEWFFVAPPPSGSGLLNCDAQPRR